MNKHVSIIDLETTVRPDETPSGYSLEEWAARVELAACYRLVDHFGWTSNVYNHITYRIPGTEHFLINPFGLLYEEICASNLVKIDIKGNKVDDSPYPVNRAGYVIHSAIHEARPDVNCVLHTHSHNATTLSTIEGGFLPITQTGCMFHERVGYHDYEGIALDEGEKSRLVADLGPDNHTLLLYNHGIITTGETASWALVRLEHFEINARVQLDAMATGQPIKRLSKDVLEHTRQQFEGGDAQAGAAVRHPEWVAWYRMLDRKDPSWRT